MPSFRILLVIIVFLTGVLAINLFSSPDYSVAPEPVIKESVQDTPEDAGEPAGGAPPSEETPPAVDDTPPPFINEAPEVIEVPPEALPREIAPVVLPFATIETQTRGAILHLFCTSRSGNQIKATTGSGVVIDPRGIVLTNAHVAQFWLLPRENPLGTTECGMRTSVPVVREYRAELLYLPPVWVRENAKDITNDNALGTGEHDYALLRITTSTDGGILPPVFPFVLTNSNEELTSENSNVLIAAYPSRAPIESLKDLHEITLVSVLATIKELLTFEKITVDVVSLGDTELSFKGSSGGAVMSTENKLVAIVATNTQSEIPSERDLRAITLSHINRSLQTGGVTNLDALLTGDLRLKAELFNENIVPLLTQRVLDELN